MERHPGADESSALSRRITVFLAGDVMSGRGIDQILPHPSDPTIHEPYLRNARDYLFLAERANGPIPHYVSPEYIWGDALGVLTGKAPDLRIINLETSITASDDYWPGKGINYRMHPGNATIFSAAKIDVCVLANNHVLDWGYPGLEETLASLERAGIRYAGAGRNLGAARQPVVLTVAGKGRVLVFSYGMTSSGILPEWGAAEHRAGVNLLPANPESALKEVRKAVRAVRQPGDIVILSIHWGGNWGYRIPALHRELAHGFIDQAEVDIVYGHSSHHVLGIEMYHDRPILYGCGDFINDYEGISGYENYRGDLGLMYFATIDPPTGRLVRLQLVPTRIEHFRINRASEEEALWLLEVLNRENNGYGTRMEINPDNSFTVRWRSPTEGRPRSEKGNDDNSASKR